MIARVQADLVGEQLPRADHAAPKFNRTVDPIVNTGPPFSSYWNDVLIETIKSFEIFVLPWVDIDFEKLQGLPLAVVHFLVCPSFLWMQPLGIIMSTSTTWSILVNSLTEA